MFILKCRIILVLVRLRCSCWGTIGALASVVLLFLNARPVVSERSEFRTNRRPLNVASVVSRTVEQETLSADPAGNSKRATPVRSRPC